MRDTQRCNTCTFWRNINAKDRVEIYGNEIPEKSGVCMREQVESKKEVPDRKFGIWVDWVPRSEQALITTAEFGCTEHDRMPF